MITELQLVHFKNYEKLKTGFSPRINFLVGSNGVGKTNLLDAIHYLCVTKSFNSAQDRYNVRFEADFFRIEGHVQRGDNRHVICAKVRPGKLKEIELDGKKVERLGDHIGFLPVIVLSPRDQVLISGASADRRRFVDFYLCQIDQAYLADLIAYNRLLTQRNAVLKEHGWRADEQLLLTYTAKMADHARRIAAARSAFVAAIQPLTENAYQSIAGQDVPLTLDYLSEVKSNDLSDLARSSIDQDRALGRTTKGIHKDDLSFDLSEHSVKRFGSQGQIKTYLIALHLAISMRLFDRTGLKPYLLLDDIFDKLDDVRVTHLVDTLGRSDFGQVFITDARQGRVERICKTLSAGARVFQLHAGVIVSVLDYPGSSGNDELAVVR